MYYTNVFMQNRMLVVLIKDKEGKSVLKIVSDFVNTWLLMKSARLVKSKGRYYFYEYDYLYSFFQVSILS